eukprot:UN03180
MMKNHENNINQALSIPPNDFPEDEEKADEIIIDPNMMNDGGPELDDERKLSMRSDISGLSANSSSICDQDDTDAKLSHIESPMSRTESLRNKDTIHIKENNDR